jgi:nucleotide-binding universal stress UspA family protein
MPRARGRIVVGVDGTKASAAAARWAAREGRLRRASVHLLFVYDNDRSGHAPYAGSSSRPRPGEDNAAGRARLAAAEQQASRTLPPDRLSSEQVEGSPARVLIDQSAGAELLVLGTAELASQSGSEGPPAVGPVARACLHAAACPVVIVAPCDAPCTPVCRRYPARGWSGRPVAEVLTCENRGVRGSSPR